VRAELLHVRLPGLGHHIRHRGAARRGRGAERSDRVALLLRISRRSSPSRAVMSDHPAQGPGFINEFDPGQAGRGGWWG
jgi:hypothetical protein